MSPDNVRQTRPQIGLMGLTLDLYEELAPELREGRERWVRDQVLPALDDIADVHFPGAAYTRRDVENIVSGFEQQDVDALMVMLLSYSPSQISLPVLKKTTLPIIIWNTQELYSVNEHFQPGDMTANHGVHGTQDLANVLVRSDVDFEYVTSHLSDQDPTAALNDYFRAAMASRRLQHTKVGLLGYPFPGMGDFAVDTTQLAATLGCSWTQLSMDDYVQRTNDVAPEKVQELSEDYNRLYDVADDITDEELRTTARAEAALKGMVDEHGLDAVTYQFRSFGETSGTETVPFVGASRLMAAGVGFGGEGDILGAAATTFLNTLHPPATFSEIFTVDYEGNAVLMSHMGESNPAMHRTSIPLCLRKRSPITDTTSAQLVLTVTVQPRKATLVSLAQGPGNDWQLITAPMTIRDFGPLESLAVPHFKMEPDGDVRDFLTAYARAGGPHHNAVCFGDARRKVHMAASILGVDYVEI